MKSYPWLPFALLLGCVAPVSAQPYGPGPVGAPYGLPPGMAPSPMAAPPAAPALPKALDRVAPSNAARGMSGPADAAAQAMRAEAMKDPAVQASMTLKKGIDTLMAFMNQKEVPNKLQVAAFLDREIAPYFDFDYMAKWVAGPAYAQMSAERRTAMAVRLEQGFLTALSGQLAAYEGQQVRLMRPRRAGPDAVSVNVAILRPGAYPGRMEFRMYQAKDGWKVYDVLANGRSAAAYYRTRFARSGLAEGAGAAPAGR